jgi:mannose-1-phosphate guanylyltransferase
MESAILIFVFSVLVATIIMLVVIASNRTSSARQGSVEVQYIPAAPEEKLNVQYTYSRKSGIMTPNEGRFFHRLTAIVAEKYYVFPQVHLSALAVNKTYGKYHKLGFQQINRRSVDYVLADKTTLQPVYAIELDDTSHDTEKARAIDALKQNDHR